MFDWMVSWLSQSGYAGVFALMLAENVFPPVPSELVMPLAGFLAAQGDLSLALVVVFGSAGSVLGAVLWYCLGLWIGEARLRRLAARHGRWLTISPVDVDSASQWFKRYGWQAVFFGRMIPAVRTLISVPAGVAGMPLPPFLTFTILGSVIWTGLLAGAGFLLESQYEKVAEWVNPVTNVVLGLVALWYLSRLVRGRGTQDEGGTRPPS